MGHSISKAQSLEEIADFWDTHSVADYWDQTAEVEFEIRAKRRRRVTLASEVYEHIEAQAYTEGFLPKRRSISRILRPWIVTTNLKISKALRE